MGPHCVDSARSTAITGTAPWALALSMMRLTLKWNLGRVKRPTQTERGSRAILQIRSACFVRPLRWR